MSGNIKLTRYVAFIQVLKHQIQL